MDSTPSIALTSLGNIVQWLDQMINQMLLSSVAGNLERIIGAIWLPLEIAVAISLMIYGVMVATQQIPTPFGKALINIFRIVFVVAIIEAGGFYQTQIMGTMLALPDELLQIITGGPGNVRDVLAEFHNAGLETATKIGDRSPSVLGDMFRAVVFATVSIVIVVLYTLVTIVGLVLMTVAKVGMALVVMLGPFFIAAYLFEPTKKYFNQWVEQALYFAFYGLIFTMVFSIVMGMLSYIQRIITTMVSVDVINVFQILGVLLLVSFVAITLLKLPAVIVQKLTGGLPIDMPIIGKL